VSTISFNKYFKDPVLAKQVAQKIHEEANQKDTYRLMEFCGGHTHAIFRYGVQSYLPSNIKMIHGPGCPVCVLPIERIDYAIYLSKLPNTIITTYGDLLRIPGSAGKSLLQSKSDGSHIAMIYSPLEALKLARENPDHRVIFFAIGFETTAPMTAETILQASKENLKNFFVVCNHVLTPAPITHLLESSHIDLDGILGPAHVSTIIGACAYDFVARDFHLPVVISGLEPLDILISILMLVRQKNKKIARVENQFIRAVSLDGNQLAKSKMAKVFTLRNSFKWRGLGVISKSAYALKDEYAHFDIERLEPFHFTEKAENKACLCPQILSGQKNPLDCKLFGTLCHPDNPIGSCMVSSEGACAAYYNYGRL
jgi:hydrogenase expression/formation protein HypD